MKKKKKGLLVWFEMDKRIELLQPFINMSDEIEFVHLHFRTREERDVEQSPFEVIYWFDYKSPYELIKKHTPEFIVGTTEGILAISLIVAAEEKNIPYYGLQHGFTPENLLDIIKNEKRAPLASVAKLKTYLQTTRFFFSSLRLKSLGRFFQYSNLFYLFYTNFPEAAINKNKYKWVKPRYYVCFSEISAVHYKNLYNLEESQIKYIGILSFDSFFKAISQIKPTYDTEKYYLLIDTSFIDYHKPISKEQIERCYHELNEYCRKEGARLYIKLHPRNYEISDFSGNDSIRVIKNLDMADLARVIVNAAGCFGFYSTLTMPISFMLPTIQIKYDDVYELGLAEKKVTPVLDFYTFEASEILFYPVTDEKKALEKEFLFATDGKAVERLKQILLSE